MAPRIGVVGAGAAGLTAAWLLRDRYDVTLFERDDEPGGHALTHVVAAGPDAGTALDVGFMVLNDRTYPTMHRLLDRLGLAGALRPSEMSFGYEAPAGGPAYALNRSPGTPLTAAAGLAPLLGDVLRLFRRAAQDLDAGAIGDATLGDYVRGLGVDAGVLRDYLVPMGAAIWSQPAGELPEAPAAFVLGFLRNHGMLAIDAGPQWLHLAGGSRTYVEAIARDLGPRLRLGCGVTAIHRYPGTIRLQLTDRTIQAVDHVVIAAHADQALAFLAVPTPEERALLGAWRYTRNAAVLHTDPAAMPADRALWASWNQRGDGALTYHLNRLQGHAATQEDYFVTLNPAAEPAPDRVLRRFAFTHPAYTPAAVASQPGLRALSGTGNTWFAGSYLGNGFHEDAIAAGAAVGAALGCPL